MNVIITDAWDSYLNRFQSEEKDIYYTESYVKLYETTNERALCLVAEDEEKVLLMPILRRKIVGYERITDYYDFETAYGYGGPIANTDDEAWIHNALQSVNCFLADHRYVCGFVRFHPLLSNEIHCKQDMTVMFDRETVVVDTEESEEDIWHTQINSKNRNMIRKAEKNGLVYEAEHDFQSVDQFIALYKATMDRLKADEFYYFNDDYFRNYIQQLRGHAFLGIVRKDEELVCGALFMYSDLFGHYHLEGSNHQYASLGGNNLLLWKTACEMHRIGIKQFHLGGGYSTDKENSLLKFKKAFGSNIGQFYIGKKLFNFNVYNEIYQEWARKSPEKVTIYGNRLLCYRY